MAKLYAHPTGFLPTNTIRRVIANVTRDIANDVTDRLLAKHFDLVMEQLDVETRKWIEARPAGR